MKKLLVALFVLILFVAGGVFVFAKYFAAPQVKQVIEKEGRAALQGDVVVGQVEIQFWPPVTVLLRDISAQTHLPLPPEKPKMSVEIKVPQTLVTVDWKELLHKRVLAAVTIEKPHIKMEVVPTTTGTSAVGRVAKSTQSAKKGNPVPPIEFGARLSIVAGTLEATQEPMKFALENWNVQFNLPSLDSSWTLDTDATTKIDTGTFQIETPLKVHSNFKFQDSLFETSESSLDLAGAEVAIKGKAQLKTEDYNFDAVISLADLASLPVPPAFLPQGKYSGSLSSKVHAEHGQKTDWVLSGMAKADKFAVKDLNFKKENLVLQGGFQSSADLQFAFKKVLIVSKILASIDMNELAVTMKDKFTKASGVPLAVEVSAQEANNVLNIDTGHARLAALNINFSGKLGMLPGKGSDIQIQVPRTPLDGFEKYFPPMSSSPLMGALEVKARLQGDFQNPQNMDVNLNPLHLDNLRGALHFAAPDKKIDGPVSLDAKAVVVAHGKNLSSASVTGKLNLSGVNIFMKDVFAKKSGVPLELVLAAKQKGRSIAITNSRLTTSAGVVNLKGNLTEPASPRLALKIESTKINLSELSHLVPKLTEWKLTGIANADLSINGNYDFAKGIEKSPLVISGKVGADIPQFFYKSAKALPQEVPSKQSASAAENKSSGVGEAVPQSLLPNWPVVRTLKLMAHFKLGKLGFNDLVMSGFDLNGWINQGNLGGALKIQQIFGGQVAATDIKSNLLKPSMDTSLQTTMTGLDIASALAFGAPQWKDLARGKLTGSSYVSFISPSSPSFVDLIVARGSAKVTDGFLSTFPFDQYANAKLKDIGGQKLLGNTQPVRTGGATANIDTKFNMSHGKVTLETFHILTPERNEMVSSGWLNIDKTMDLRGTIYLATAQVGGDVKEGNTDSSGRLVVPSVHFSGSVMKPDADFSQTLGIMTKNALAKKADKVKSQLQQQAGEEVKKQINKVNIPDDAKKQLQNIFGN